MGEAADWTISILASLGTAAAVAAWRPRLALLLAPVAAVAFALSLGFSIDHWEECDPCPRVEHVFAWVNSILLVLAPSLVVAGLAGLVVKRPRAGRPAE